MSAVQKHLNENYVAVNIMIVRRPNINILNPMQCLATRVVNQYIFRYNIRITKFFLMLSVSARETTRSWARRRKWCPVTRTGRMRDPITCQPLLSTKSNNLRLTLSHRSAKLQNCFGKKPNFCSFDSNDCSHLLLSELMYPHHAGDAY